MIDKPRNRRCVCALLSLKTRNGCSVYVHGFGSSSKPDVCPVSGASEVGIRIALFYSLLAIENSYRIAATGEPTCGSNALRQCVPVPGNSLAM